MAVTLWFALLFFATTNIMSSYAKNCDPNPCKNGGTCELDAKKRVSCKCTSDWLSTYCEQSNI